MTVVDSPTGEAQPGDEAAGPAVPRLNPFALPTDTTSRFALLVVAVLGASVFAYSLLAVALPATRDRRVRAEQCVAAVEATTPVPPSASQIQRDDIILRSNQECRQPALRWQALMVVGGLGSLLLVALALYLLIPTWMVRRRRLVPLEEEDAPELVGAYRELCRQAGLLRLPKLVWDPLAPGSAALAFGRFNHSFVAVGAGLVVQFFADPQAATAVLRHEVAHVANRDVSKTYLALSLWYAFLTAALVPLVVLDLTRGGFLTFATIWRLVALALLIYAARNAVLRTREYYADAWAGSRPEARSALAKILHGLPRARWARQRAWFSLHPDPPSRAQALGDTHHLFRPRLGDALAAGLLAGFASPIVTGFLFLILPFGYTLYLDAVGALVSAVLVGVVLGTVVWRAALAARVLDRPFPRVALLAVAAAVGVALGWFLSLYERETSADKALLLVAFMLASVYWLVSTADAWFDAVPSARSGRPFALAAFVAAGLVAWSTGWVSVIDIGDRAGGTDSLAFWAGYIASHPLTPWVVASLVLFPLAAALVRRRVRSDSTPAWVAATGPSGEPARWPQRPPLAVARALGWGALGGTAFCLLVVALRAVDVSPRSLVKPVDEAAFQYAPGIDYAPIALTLVLHAVVSAVVALRARRLPLLHALLALPASVLLMTAGVTLPYLLDGDGLPNEFSDIARHVLTGGAIAALVVGGAVDVLRRASPRVRLLLAGLGAVGLAAAVVWGAQSTPNAPTSAALAPEVAHKVAAAQVRGDPAISQLSFETFDALGLTVCEGLNTGGSALADATRFSQAPTGQGIPMRLQSAKAIVAASIRAYCPHHASQLADLEARE